MQPLRHLHLFQETKRIPAPLHADTSTSTKIQRCQLGAAQQYLFQPLLCQSSSAKRLFSKAQRSNQRGRTCNPRIGQVQTLELRTRGNHPCHLIFDPRAVQVQVFDSRADQIDGFVVPYESAERVVSQVCVHACLDDVGQVQCLASYHH